MELKIGDKVRYLGDPFKSYIVARQPRPDSQFVMLVDHWKRFPECECYHVPAGRLEPASAPPPKRVTKAPPKVEMPQLKDLDDFFTAARARDCTQEDIENLLEIWHRPSPNSGVRVMRMRNYFKFHLQR